MGGVDRLRAATTDPTLDPEVISRTRELDKLKASQREAQATLERLDKELLDPRQAISARHAAMSELLENAEGDYRSASFRQELRVIVLTAVAAHFTLTPATAPSERSLRTPTCGPSGASIANRRRCCAGPAPKRGECLFAALDRPV